MLLNNDVNPFSLAKRINRPLILDGAIGSLLQQKNQQISGAMWMSKLNLDNPEIILKVYKDYINAGADIITTNTFRTNPVALKDFPNLKIEKLVKNSIKIAKDASDNLPVFIAGSNAPAEDCYKVKRKISKKTLEYNHHKHIELLHDLGAHFLLNETQGHLDEIKIICKYCSKNKIPYVISLFSFDGKHLLSGETISEAVNFILDHSPLAISFNCIIPDYFNKIKKFLKNDFNWGVYFNCGSGDYTDEQIACGISPTDYASEIYKLLKYSPSFVGACCGSNPNHIKEIKNLLDGKTKS